MGAAFPHGWTVIVADRCDHQLISDETLRAVSAEAPVLACSVEEHVMFGSAEHWTGGTQRWRVSHQGDSERRNLVVAGEPPPELAAIRDQCASNQDAEESNDPGDGVDWFFEIPLVLARPIAGFKHDEELPAGLEGFVELRPLGRSTARQRWWKF